MPTTKLLVFGQVQGVGFRYWVKGKFNELGIEGDIWNNDDGSVGVEITSSSEPGVKKLIELLKQGPPLARVKKVAIL